MTFDIFSITILALCLVGLYLGWCASLYIGRLVILLWRLGIAAAFGVGLVYAFYCAWPWLVELQQSGQVYFPAQRWEVTVR